VPHAALDHALQVGLESGVGDDAFRVGAVKLFVDGTLGSRTAAVLEPYDGTDQRGLDVLAPADLVEIVRRALEGRLSVAFHAIGDRAVRSALDALESGRALLPGLALRPRLEHVQLIAADDVRRLAELEVFASMQPTHCTSDIELAERYWKTRAARTYPWRLLSESGVPLAFGSDAPVESPSIAAGLHAAVTRERPDRAGAWVPEQRIDLDRALDAYTRGPAQLGGAWPRLGALRSGAWADLVVWNADLHRLEPRGLLAAHPVLTAIAGHVVHEAAAPAGVAPRASSERRVMA
jgi:predicted amidohydrolase YtcJ